MSTIAARRASAIARWDQTARAVSSGRARVDRTRWIITHSRAVLDRPYPPFRGGSDPPVDEATVRQRVQKLVDNGMLGHFNSGHILSAPCRTERDCTICSAGITLGEMQVELVSNTGAVVINLHRRCFEIWNRETEDG